VRGRALVGKVGEVVSTIRGGDLAGEIRVVVQGVPHHYLAYAAQELPAGTHVLIVHFRGERQVDVEPWFYTPRDHSTF
jgi:membrane protein implicated in regulation of membrane protease activity